MSFEFCIPGNSSRVISVIFDDNCESALGPYEDLVLETAFCLAFFGFLRCGEFTSRPNTFDPLIDLRMCDIEIITRGTTIDVFLSLKHLGINLYPSF